MVSTSPGSRPASTQRDDGAYLDFAEGARYFILTQLSPAIRQKTVPAVERAFAGPGPAPTSIDEIESIMQAEPAANVGYRVQRSVQEMIWRKTHETLYKRKDELLAELARYDRMGPGSVEWDPNFVYPDYCTRKDGKGVEFHLEVGGYSDPLGGYIYHLGGNVFHGGLNDQHKGNSIIVNNVPLPKDGQVRRVLELACAPGLSSLPLKERFPNAEVWATDISSAMVRYAHKRAVDVGLDIHFKQMAAENITFPDNHFDVVFVHILFHELPTDISRKVMREVHRVLRPGGIFGISDTNDFSSTQPNTPARAMGEYSMHWQALYNGEIYMPEFFKHDLAGMMKEAGFRNVIPNYSENIGAWNPNAGLPVRIGEK